MSPDLRSKLPRGPLGLALAVLLLLPGWAGAAALQEGALQEGALPDAALRDPAPESPPETGLESTAAGDRAVADDTSAIESREDDGEDSGPIGLLYRLYPEFPWTLGAPEAVTVPDLADLEAGGPLALDLERAVALALQRNPGLKALEERRSEVVGGIRQARADALPQLALVASWGQSRNPAFLNSPDFESLLDQFPEGSFEPSTQELYRLSLEFSQALYTFGKVGAGLDLAELAGRIVEVQLEAARLDTALATAEAYFDLLAARRSLEVTRSQLAARQGALDVVEARFEIGEATLLEQLRARSSLTEVGPLIADQEGRIEVAESRLRAQLDLPPGTPLAIEDDAPRPASPPPLEELVAVAWQERPELEDLVLQAESLGIQVRILEAEELPRIDLSGRLGREVRLLENVDDPLYDDWAVTLAFRWEFFDGGRRRGEIDQLESQRRQLSWQLAELEREVVLAVDEARTGLTTALARLDASRVAAEVAREAARVAEETYREGVSLQADLLDAQQREVEAEVALTSALAASRTEAARLTRALGRLPGRDDPWTGLPAAPTDPVDSLLDPVPPADPDPADPDPADPGPGEPEP